MRRKTHVGDVFVDKYGQTFTVRKIVKRGAVGVLGSDIHEVLREWSELAKDWKPKP